jgi:hypothetical protein
MAKKTELALALAGVALCAGVVWFALSPMDAPAQASNTAFEVPAQSSSAVVAAVETTEAAPDPIRALAVAETNDAPRASVASAPAFHTGDAIWVEGRVVFPPDTPADERAEVLAHYKDHGEDDEKPHRATVAADTTFRVAFPRGTESGWLELRARYSYLYEPVRLTFDGPLAPVVLEPDLGGCIRATFVLPVGSESRVNELVETEVSGYATNRVRTNGESASFTRSVEVERPPHVEVGGLAPGLMYQIYGTPETFAPFEIRGQRVRAGTVSALQIPLENGVRLRGQVVDEHDQPIAGATFRTVVATGNESTYSDRESATGADGRFDLRGIRPGRITLTTTARGYLTSQSVIESAANESSHDDIRAVLRRGRSIRGRVAWRDGQPVSAASVTIALEPSGISGQQSEALGWSWEQREFTAAADGTFEITGLTAGPFTLIARNVGEKEDKTRVSVRQENVISGGDSIELTLDAGAELRGRVVDDMGSAVQKFTVDATPATGDPEWQHIDDSIRGEVLGEDGRFVIAGLRACNWRITARANGASVSREVVVPADGAAFEILLPRPASISGLVVDPEGRPAVGARVSFGLASANGRQERVLATSKPTGIDGSFAIERVFSGPAVLIARHLDWAPSESERIDLAPGETRSDVVVGLRASGKVTGEIRRADGQADPMRSLYAHGVGGADGVSVSDESDANGLFEFPGLPAGEYWIQTQANLFERESVRGADGENNWQALQNFTRRASVTVIAGQSTHVVLGEPPRAPVRVFGRVTRNGREVEGISVSATRSDPQSGSRDTKTASTGADGRYELSLDEPGNYWFRVSRQMRGTNCQRQETIPEQREVAIDFELPDGRIAGRVLSPEGEPVAQLQIELNADSSMVMTPDVLQTHFGYSTTGDDGRFAFEYLLPGTYSIRAGETVYWGSDQDRRYSPAALDGLVLAEHASIDDLELKLGVAGRIEVEVAGAKGEPIAGAEVFTFDESGTLIEDPSGMLTDAAGRRRVGALTEGRVLVFARKGSIASAVSAPVPVRAGEMARVTVTLRAATLLDVVVERAEAATEVDVVVRDERGIEYTALWSWGGASSPHTNISIAGQQIGPLPPGRYRVSPSDPELEKHGVDVVVAGDEVQKVRITLPK